MQADDKLMLEKMYEPVTKPLNSMSQSLEKQKLQNVLQSDRPTSKKKTELDISSNFFTPIHRKWKGILDGSDSDEENSVASYEENSPEIYIEGLYNKPSEYDTVYGVRTEKKHKNKYFIGDAEAKFNSGNIDLWRNNEKIGSFKGSNELYDLLFLKKPKVLDNLTKLSDNTLETYREILKRTHAMNHNYNKDKKIRTSRWPKFSELLDPLFKPTQAIVHQPLPMEFPHFNNGTFHYPFYFFETAALFNGGYINTATDLITVSLIWIAAIQLRILNRKLRDTERNVRRTDGYSEFNVERLTLDYLTECCVHYMDIEEFIINLQEVFSVIIFVQMGASVLAICNTGINLVTFESIPETLALTVYVTVMLVQLGLYCWFGNRVFTESEDITTSCYMSPWYKRSTATKKILFLLMERSKRPMKISGLKFFVLKFNTFISILKFTYSYFTLLRKNSNA
ncbi:unnamed protein product [Ceutorhynchus assimilis]|uniref:Odorant receptor n=1 Tax=Ceutorhynchus assimilis TaxID=467358 RepID=A0A9N9MBR9_9CUCU|nr:unnamed protein product [Ceutorhynchus assimilis]